MITWLAVVVAVVQLILARSVTRSWGHPAVVLSGVWVFALLSTISISIEYDYILSYSTVGIILVGNMSFLVGSLLAYVKNKSHKVRYNRVIIGAPDFLSSVLVLGTAIIILPFYVSRAIDLAASGDTPYWYMNLRIGIIRGDGYGWRAYGVTLAYAGVIISRIWDLKNSTRFSRSIVYLSVVVLIVYGVLSTGRTFVLLGMVVYSVPLLLWGRVEYKKFIPVALVVFFAIFGIYASVLKKGLDSSDGIIEQSNQLYHSVRNYAAGGIVGLDHIMNSDLEMTYGSNSFRTFDAILSKAGVDVDVEVLIKEFVSHPIPTNVYTVHALYLYDFGIMYVILFQICIGYVCSMLYAKVLQHKSNSVNMYILTVSYYPLVMQPFQDQYLSLASTYIQFAIVWLLFVAFIRMASKRKVTVSAG